MALRVFILFRPCFSPWRHVERTPSQHQMRFILHLSTSRYLTSKSTAENEWTLDLEMDPEGVDHAPIEEPHPQHPAHIERRSATSEDNRLLFSVGKRLMTADQFVQKASAVDRWQRSPVTMETLDINDDAMFISDDVIAIEDDGMGDKEEGGSVWVDEEGRGDSTSSAAMGNKRGGGIYSMRQTRKYLRGKALINCRLTTPPIETTKLMECLHKTLNSSEHYLEQFSTVPSVLGSDVMELEKKVNDLSEMGFSKIEVETLLLAFPSILDVDYKNVYSVCNILKKCIPGGHVLRGLIRRHPFLFIQPVKQVKMRLETLKNVCRDPNSLGFLLHHFPILLLTSLTPSTLHTITQLTSSPRPHTEGGGEGGRGQMGHSWTAKSLYHNLSTLPAKLELGPDIASLIGLLREFQLDPASTLLKFPGFFKTTYTHVASLLDILTGAPLYLDTLAIRTILCSIPDQLVWTEDAQQLQTHLQKLLSLFSSAKECSEKVLHYPGLILPEIDLDKWLQSLTDHEFTNTQIAVLVSGTPSVLLQDIENDFIPKLKLLLSVPDTTTASLMACSVGTRVSLFSTHQNVLRARLNYILKYKPEMASGEHLSEIFTSRDKEFAAFCGRSVDQVHSETGLGGVELKRFKSRQKSLRQRKPLIPTKTIDLQSHQTTNTTSNVVECNTLSRSNDNVDRMNAVVHKKPLRGPTKRETSNSAKSDGEQQTPSLKKSKKYKQENKVVLNSSMATKSKRKKVDAQSPKSATESRQIKKDQGRKKGEFVGKEFPGKLSETSQAAGSMIHVMTEPSLTTYGGDIETDDKFKTQSSRETASERRNYATKRRGKLVES